MKIQLTFFGIGIALALVVQGPAYAQADGNPVAGRALAFKSCASCHVVAPHQPLHRLRATGPAFKAVANAKTTTAMGLHVFLVTPHSTMPNLILTEDERADVTAYILSLRTRP